MMKKVSILLLLSVFFAVNPSDDFGEGGSNDRVQLHLLTTTESLEDLLSTVYTNVFLFVCPDNDVDSLSTSSEVGRPRGSLVIVDAAFRGCNEFMSRVVDVVGSFRQHPVMNLRFGVGVMSASSPLAKSFRLDAASEASAVLYARKNHAGETHVAQFVGDMTDDNLDEMFVTMWARDNGHSFLRDLNEDNFEHLTQASSGATTGDWLVAFGANAADWRKDAATRLALDTIASEYKHQLSVAFVDVKTNPKLADRLKVKPPTTTPTTQKSSSKNNHLTLRYFRLEKMYHYDLDKINFQSLRAFVTGAYRHAKVEKVPTEPTPFDQLVEKVVTRLKTFGYPSFMGTLILILAFASAMSILIVLACCASKEGKEQDTKFKKG